jgi:xylulokinase
MALVLGVDSSTQSTKVEMRDADTGELVGSGRAPHPATSPPRSEQDPETWRDALIEARQEAGAPAVVAMAIAAQQHGLVALDAQGQVIRPAKLWNDTESAPDAQWLVDELGGPQAWTEACGSMPVASFTISKLSWMHRTEPDDFDRIAQVLLPHDWLTYKMSGRFTTDRGDASGTGYWSPAESRWRPDLLAVVDDAKDWDSCLPEVLGPTDVVREREGAVIAPGTGDNMAAALGVALQPGHVAISLGTSGTVCTVSDSPVADPKGYVAGFADASGRFLPLVCTLNATKVVHTFARLLQADLTEFDQLALSAPPGAGGVVLVPYLAGERTPNLPDATGTLGGLRGEVTAEQLARAAVEGVVCGLLDALDALRVSGVRVNPGEGIVLLGGGARSHAFQRVLADLSRSPVIVPGGEPVATGACVQAAAVLHQTPPQDVAEAWKLGAGHAVDPDERVDARAVRAAYAEMRARDYTESSA